MRLFVTGGAGFIGSHFVEAAEAAGHEVEIVDCLNYAGRRANLVPGRHVNVADICDRLMMQALVERIRPDAIIHLAAESHVARSIECRDEFLRTNVMGTNVLLEVALEHWRASDCNPAFRFLHVSTDEVYGSLGLDEPPWTEASPYAPNNPYAASKAASDHMVRAYHRTFGLPTIITHSSNNYGPRQHPEKLIPTLIGQILRGEPMTLHGSGLHMRDWLHVEDHRAGLLAALMRGKPGETYNFGGTCERTNLQIAHLIHEIAKPKTLPDIKHVEDRAGNDTRYATDASKSLRDLRWRPGPQIETRLAETILWYDNNPHYELDYGR